jgi:predicted Zn-dependent protease
VAAARSATDATVLVLAASQEESGYADASSWRAGDLDPAAVAARAAEIARRTRGAGTLEPGTYRAVLEPSAFASLLWFFALTSLGSLALLEGRSYLSGRLGESLYHPSFTLVDDGRDPRGFPKAFDFEGVPKQCVTLVEDGIARDVVWDRRTAKRAGGGRASTGHALTGPAQAFGPIPLNLCVRGGDATTGDLIERTGDGIYVTRLHYLNIVDPRAGILTGMTRDGTFLIEGGKVTRPLVNLRFTTSFPDFAAKLLGLSRDIKLVNLSDFYDERLPLGALVPAAASESFTIVGTGSRPGL